MPAPFQLKAEGWLYGKLTTIVGAVTGLKSLNDDGSQSDLPAANVGIFPGIQLPTAVTPYVCYSCPRSNFSDRPLGSTEIPERGRTMLVELMCDLMAGQLDLLANTIISGLDGQGDNTNVQACFLEDFRWASQVLTAPKFSKLVLHGSIYLNVWEVIP